MPTLSFNVPMYRQVDTKAYTLDMTVNTTTVSWDFGGFILPLSNLSVSDYSFVNLVHNNGLGAFNYTLNDIWMGNSITVPPTSVATQTDIDNYYNAIKAYVTSVANRPIFLGGGIIPDVIYLNSIISTTHGINGPGLIYLNPGAVTDYAYSISFADGLNQVVDLTQFYNYYVEVHCGPPVTYQMVCGILPWVVC